MPDLGPKPDDDRLFTSGYVRLLAMQAAYGFAFSLFFLLPKYLAATGETASRIGLVMSGFGVACILTIPFLPVILRQLGRRGALIAATVLMAVAATAFAAVDRPGWTAIPLRASEGVTWTIMFSTALALTAEMAPRHRLAQAIGIAGAASLIMNAVAPAIGEPLADRFGYRWVFALAAVAALGAAALARRLPASADRDGAAAAARADARAAEVGPAGAPVSRLGIYAAFGVAGLAFGSLFTFLAPFALERGVHAIRLFFIGHTASALAVRVLGGRMTDRIGHRSVAVAALAFYGLVVASAGVLGPHHLFVLGIGFGLGHGAAFPALMALLISGATGADRPRVLGIANGAMSTGISAVFPAGLLIARLGYPTMFALAGGLTAAAAALIRRPRSG
jgi:MFS family permease